MNRHHHAFAYTGRACTDSEVIKGIAPSTYAPFLIADWLRRPAKTIAETFTDPGAAAEWLRVEMEAQPPIDAASFGVDGRVRYAEATLRQEAGADVVWGYYSSTGQYVSRAVIACPRFESAHEGGQRIPCPQGRA